MEDKVRLANHLNRCCQKAIHLCEVAGMLRRFGKYNLARKMFRRAAIVERHAVRLARKLGLEETALVLESNTEDMQSERDEKDG